MLDFSTYRIAIRNPQSAIRNAALEVARPIVFGIAIIIAVYLPLFALEGLEARMFRPMALTVVCALLGALLLTITGHTERRPGDASPSRVSVASHQSAPASKL